MISAFCSIVFLPACRSASEKLIEAKQTERSDANKIITEAKVVVTQSETDSLQKMQRDFLDSWEDFKKESEAKIIKNEKDLVSLSASIANRDLEMRIAYRKVVADLRVKNENLKERLARFAEPGRIT